LELLNGLLRTRGKSCMPGNDKILIVVQEWAAKAENDLKNAAHTLKLGRDCPTDTVCFHAQQCVEKYLKAFLVIAFLTVEEQRRLTEYATVMRYPGPYEPIRLCEAKEAVRIARLVRRKILKLMEKKPLF